MAILSFFKKQWNIVTAFAVAVVTLLSDIVIPPNISLTEIEGLINMTSLTKFIVASCTLLMLVPLTLFKKRKYLWHWWTAAIATLFIGTYLFFTYNNFVSDHTVYNTSSFQRVVIGKTLLPLAKKAIDEARVKQNIDFTDQLKVITLGGPDKIWVGKEIRDASIDIMKFYLVLMLVLSFFLLFATQATYCLSTKNVE